MSHQPPEYGIAPPLHEPPTSPKWPWAVLLVAVLLAVGGLAFGNHVAGMVQRTFAEQPEPSGPPPPTPPPVVPPPVPAKRVVVFEVIGTGTAFNVTAAVGAAEHSQSGVPLPWTKTIEVPAEAAAKSVMLVVVAGPDGAEVHGKYTIDGQTVREGKASGPYGVLTITDS
jgi:hypothetical protein